MNVVRSAEIQLDPHPASVGRARRWLSRQLEAWDLEDLDYDTSVVVSELVTNAVLHAHTRVTVTATYDRSLRLEVSDSASAMPIPRGSPSSTTGRGLHLVAALATAWGYETQATGKVVWAEFADESVGEDDESVSGPVGRSATITSLARMRSERTGERPLLERTV